MTNELDDIDRHPDDDRDVARKRFLQLHVLGTIDNSDCVDYEDSIPYDPEGDITSIERGAHRLRDNIIETFDRIYEERRKSSFEYDHIPQARIFVIYE